MDPVGAAVMISFSIFYFLSAGPIHDPAGCSKFFGMYAKRDHLSTGKRTKFLDKKDAHTSYRCRPEF
jgi:hypothetical protein